MTDALDRAVAAAFPDRDVREVTPQHTRPGNETARVTFADAPPVYLKTATDTTRRLEREAAATRYARANCPVGVPHVVAADPDGDSPYLACAPLAGTPLNDPWTGDGDRERLVREAGRLLAGVHEARFERPGVVVGGDTDGLELRGESWTEALCRTVEWRAEDWFADRFRDLPPRLVETIREVDPAPGECALLHADASRINVFLDPGGLIDWERALVGDPTFDLTDAVSHLVEQVDVEDADEPRLREALYDGYRERAGSLPDGYERRRPLYRAVAHLLVPQTFEEWAEDVDRPNDDLAADVREEFGRRLERARDAG